uniref:Uncharacterized protein n=1 Tax=Globisporangium ultimum (strain ATCC 200006 / CBS 805.95 / DAOM BR144) TaxID=431595 RepID=K3W7Y7_GLOUD
MRTPETPESIRAQYASPRGESADERRKRLTNRRAAKYRYFRSLDILQGLRREKDNTRQRDRRRQLDDATKCRVREQNRIRQQVRRQTLSDAAREEIREKHRMRQQMRRQRLDDQARDALREKERLRVRMRPPAPTNGVTSGVIFAESSTTSAAVPLGAIGINIVDNELNRWTVRTTAGYWTRFHFIDNGLGCSTAADTATAAAAGAATSSPRTSSAA